ncbi:small ubiquitin-related modifier 1 [Sorghum bicolor]|uniref:Ubiquitin-like domain-containing protein n=1 Tax=Sorghum bicolor TaxID=4558 RepID=A0A1B6Q710_SORBI|nr:small ubiquitin-related modifier 1 [Sorghum bicolor]KXG33713.1 hypothetical protein SORBI_3003G359000 [Sorghum bicolor]|eukprot:XP_021310729.1 small ubiquitin-related modifier 1 [Sorghum bicolor]
MSTPSPASLGYGAEEEEEEERGKGAEAEEERGEATKTVKAEAGEDGGSDALINVKVQSQTADDVFFRVKRDLKLRRLMDMYCGKHSLHPKAVLFLDPVGRTIRPNQTPNEVGLDDGDAIHIMLTQVGGGARARHTSA